MIRKKILLVLVSLVVVAIALPCLGDTVTYEYDNLYRLIKATYSDGTVIEYTYDMAGNRLTKVIQPGDSDEDGLPDALEATTCTDPQDPDTDDDGLQDGAEDANANGVVDASETNPCNADTDEDGMPDGWEVQYGLDPLTDDAGGDLDGDGLTNLQESTLGSYPNDADTDDDALSDGIEDANHNGVMDSGETNPCNADTDEDGMPDGWEVQYGLDPLTDDAAGDLDGDGVSNLDEYTQGTNPNDADGDGVTDTEDPMVDVMSSKYYVLTPELAEAAIGVVSLVDGNVITAGSTVLNLDKFQSGEIPADAVSPGGVIWGIAPFSVGSEENKTDMPVPASFVGTAFVMPHARDESEYTYYILSLEGDAQVQITIGVDTTTITALEGQVVTVDAGSDYTISGIITSDLPILVCYTAPKSGGTDIRDVYPVPPASTDIVGVRSKYAIIGALEDNTSVSVYASDGSSITGTLNAGERKYIPIGDNSSQGIGSALHVVADKPVAAVQHGDGDGSERTAFFDLAYLGTDYGIPVDTQYVAVACLDADTVVTLYDSASTQLDQQVCSGDGTTPGKAYFGSETDGTHIAAGSRIESTRLVYVIYEASASNDEHNLLGVTLDTDGDGMPDGWEIFYWLDPLVDDASGDLDNDGVTNLEEYNQGTIPTPSPTVTINADPITIYEGNSSTLTWTSTYANTVSIDQGVGAVDQSGSTSVTPAETTTYTITATGPSGTATDSVTVTVTTPPTPQTITLRPNATGDHTGISYQVPASGAHYNKVDEVTADDYSTYLMSMSSAYEYDLFNIPDHTTETGAINYVKIYYRALTNGTGYFKPAVKTGGTVYYGTEQQGTKSWTTYNYTWNTNPHTGAAWTWDDIDALQIGIAMKVYGYCTQVYVEVNYTPSGGQ